MKNNYRTRILIVASLVISGCALINIYSPPTTGDVSYISIVDFRTALITGEAVHAGYRLGEIEDDGCVSVLSLERVLLNSLDDQGRLVVPANTELALLTAQSDGRIVCDVSIASSFEKDSIYEWDFSMDDESCQLGVRRKLPDGLFVPIELEKINDRLTKYCK